MAPRTPKRSTSEGLRALCHIWHPVGWWQRLRGGGQGGKRAWKKVSREGGEQTPQCHRREMDGGVGITLAEPGGGPGWRPRAGALSTRPRAGGSGRPAPPGARRSSRGDPRGRGGEVGAGEGARAGPDHMAQAAVAGPPGIAFFLFREPRLPRRPAAAHRPGPDRPLLGSPRCHSLVARGHHLLALAVAERVRLPGTVLGARCRRGCGRRRPRLLLLLLGRRASLAQLLQDLRGRAGQAAGAGALGAAAPTPPRVEPRGGHQARGRPVPAPGTPAQGAEGLRASQGGSDGGGRPPEQLAQQRRALQPHHCRRRPLGQKRMLRAWAAALLPERPGARRREDWEEIGSAAGCGPCSAAAAAASEPPGRSPSRPVAAAPRAAASSALRRTRRGGPETFRAHPPGAGGRRRPAPCALSHWLSLPTSLPIGQRSCQVGSGCPCAVPRGPGGRGEGRLTCGAPQAARPRRPGSPRPSPRAA